MLAKKERELLVEYVVQHEDNLSIALALASAFDEIRKRIILRFLSELEGLLRQSLDGSWVIQDGLKDDVFERYEGFFIQKRVWKDRYRIGFSPEQYSAKRFVIGVQGNPGYVIAEDDEPKELPASIDGGALKSALDANYKPGLSSGWWGWYQWVESPYTDWDKEEPLIRMYRGDAANYFKDHILRIKDIAANIIDGLVKK